MSRNKKKFNKLVLVTGGAGFIGSHVVDELIERGYSVRIMDNLSTTTHPKSILPKWLNKKAEFYRGDVNNKKDWLKALYDVDFVFHLAAYMDQHSDFSKYYLTNAVSVARMYEVIVEQSFPVKKIVFASSQAVYGEGKYFCKKHGIFYPPSRSEEQLKRLDWTVRCPLDNQIATPLASEEGDALHPENSYGLSKKNLEEIVSLLGASLGIPYVLLRYSIVHGTRQSLHNLYSGALRQFAIMALSGRPVILHEDGGQLRDFVNIKDVVVAHMLVLENSAADFKIFNVGSGRKDLVAQLAKLTATISGSKLKHETPGLYRINTARNSFMNIGALRAIGWKPQYTLQDNVKDYIEWLRKHQLHASKKLRKILRKIEEEGIVRGAHM